MEMRDMGHLPREMVHLPRDMHIPIHPAVKNDEKVFHGRETGDGDAPSPWGDDPYPDASL